MAQVNAAQAGGQPAPAPKYTFNPWTIATFMEALDSSIANVALPHIAGSLSASNNQATWVLTSYLVSNGIILPLGGWLSEVLGRKRFYMTCVALFTACSFLCESLLRSACSSCFACYRELAAGDCSPVNRPSLPIPFHLNA